MSTGLQDYEVAIIGGGSAGFAAARTAAAAGLKVAVVEGGREVGGLCILRGCMPTKALLYAAEIADHVRRAGLWGIRTGPLEVDFAAVMARKDRLTAEFAEHRRSQLQSGPFALLRTRARFRDPHSLRLDSGEVLRAGHFVIATGSVISPPPLAELAKVGALSSDEALALGTLPPSLVVLGGGAVGVELAQFFERLGTRVSLVQRSPRILKSFDPDLTDALTTALESEGLTVIKGTRLLGASQEPDGRRAVKFEYRGALHEVRADQILCALGRRPNTDGLGLDRAGVQTDKAGCILADSKQQTSVPHIFAAGDCVGPDDIVHVAVHQGEIAAHNIAYPDRPRQAEERLSLRVVFTEPQVACVGLSEQEAQARGIQVAVASHPFSDHGKSLIMGARHGHVKLLADPASGEILGGGCVGPLGGELIHCIVAAMAGRLTVHQLASMPHYHPTLAEIWTYPAEELIRRAAHS